MGSKYFPNQTATSAELVKKPAWATAVAPLPPTSGKPDPLTGVKKDLKWVRGMAAEYTEMALKCLAEALGDDDGRVRIAAANSLLDRAWGGAPKAVAVEAHVRVSMAPEELHARIVAVVDAVEEKPPLNEDADGHEID